MDLNTETSTSDHYDFFLPFLVQSPWNLGTQQKTLLNSSSLWWTHNCLERILSLLYIAAEWMWTYSNHISRDHYPASLLVLRLDLQKIRHVVTVHCHVSSPHTRKTQLPLLRVGPCLQICCMATHWSNPLQYITDWLLTTLYSPTFSLVIVRLPHIFSVWFLKPFFFYISMS
jgi:hypothetical protein